MTMTRKTRIPHPVPLVDSEFPASFQLWVEETPIVRPITMGGAARSIIVGIHIQLGIEEGGSCESGIKTRGNLVIFKNASTNGPLDGFSILFLSLSVLSLP